MAAKFKITVVCAIVLSVGGYGLTAAMIEDFSSTGGQTQNKTGPKDQMYLAESGDEITFTIDGATTCAWFVDKVGQEETSGSFTWTVPEKKGLWEIRAEVDGSWIEWAVSNLSATEAPVIFDYFVDGKITDRVKKDPWDRALPEWNTESGKDAPDASGGHVEFDGMGENIFLPSNVHLGTWRFRFRYMGGPDIENLPEGGATAGSYCKLKVFYMVTGVYGNMNKSQVTCHMVDDGHNWPRAYILDSVTPHICPFADHKLVEEPCARMFGDKVRMCVCATTIPIVGMWGSGDRSWDWINKWGPVQLIRTPDGYYRMWKGPGPYPGHNSYFPDSLVETNCIKDESDTMSMCDKFGFAHDPQRGPRHAELDNVAVWKDQYLWPTKSAVYGPYVHAFDDPTSGVRTPLYQNGITIEGRDVRLADIAAMVNNPSVFEYNAATKTAICKTNLHIQGGSEFVMDGDTLKMDCSTPGQWRIRVKNGATIRLNNSTITTTGAAPYRWAFNTEFNNEPVYNGLCHIHFSGIFTAEGCTIDNFGGLFMNAPDTLVLKNSNLTRMVDITLEQYCKRSPPKRWQGYVGDVHSFTLYARQPCTKFLIQGCTFSANEPVKLKFLGLDGFIYRPTLQNCTFNNVTLWAKKGQKYYYNKPAETVPLFTDNYNNCDMNLVNVDDDGLEVIAEIILDDPRPQPSQASFAVKYYLDVQAPAGTKVTVINETDPTQVPMNMKAFVAWCDEYSLALGGKEACGQIGRKMPCTSLEMSMTTVGAGGHTPLPSDTENTMVLTDFVQDSEGQTEFTYTIIAEKDGEVKVITGVNPGPTWYRPDAETPTHTVVVVFDGEVAVCNRRIFYNNSAFDGENVAANADDDGAIAPNKTALLSGETATFGNYTSYSRGINGIMIDIANLPETPTASDFIFKVGNDDTLASWTPAPVPTSITVREGAGLGGSDRITIVWADNAIQKQWLQVTVKATDATGLASDDVFYFGNAIGETGNSTTDAMVKPTDEIGARNNPHTLGGNPAGIDDVYDFDRDKKVGPTDEIIARNNGTNSLTALQLITIP